jgi:uroporphyrinogen decarboxylase
MIAHKEADRVPITDGPWAGTVSRWKREGMPADADWREYFDVDKFAGFNVDVSPRYAYRVLEDNETYSVFETEYGVRMKKLKGEDCTPEFLDYKICNPARWAEAKARITHADDRIPWEHLKRSFPKWRADGCWIDATFWFGFDVTHSWIVGMETVLIAMLEEPEWIADIFHTMLDANIALYDKVWDAGYRFDSIYIYDDMGYKFNQFFSGNIYRSIVKPGHKRAIEWAANKGIPTRLHSCGMIEPFIPDFIEMGLSVLNPLEVKAGMDPIKLKKLYGDKLTLQGGVNAVLWDKPDEVRAEIERVVPVLKEGGGYIFSSDHSIPNAVSLEDFKGIVELVKKIGAYS